ncbi:MAG: iron-sulfur cluster assembly accessory protein [Bacteroidota bacterium]|nr:iron-sulfur cluster assembly accessory protein [Bacteroidota bacterium]MDP4230759.1 iron-sulfur cluster assembly accessory protein [Bacteroidota bacterium]MDP4236439.1 iron-sulfur cluster assembly accessory protein [Bacteroidota bacterium]
MVTENDVMTAPSLEETTVEKAFENIEEEIVLTEKARTEIAKIMAANNIPDTFGLRVGVKGGGCSGLSYSLGFDKEAREGDKQIIKDGVRIFIDPKSLFYLSGTHLDYTDGLNGKGFVFNNPNASKSCGCGSSFGV